MKSRILWVEDNAFNDLVNMAGPILTSGNYDLTIALDASEGLRHLTNREFDAVIVDIRLPPGRDEEFISIYNKAGQEKASSRLGLWLLRRVLQPADKQSIPSWIKPEKFGIFTVESRVEVEQELESLKIGVYLQKTEWTPRTALLYIIEKIMSRS
jgi:CheY-like chemotaxis protein